MLMATNKLGQRKCKELWSQGDPRPGPKLDPPNSDSHPSLVVNNPIWGCVVSANLGLEKSGISNHSAGECGLIISWQQNVSKIQDKRAPGFVEIQVSNTQQQEDAWTHTQQKLCYPHSTHRGPQSPHPLPQGSPRRRSIQHYSLHGQPWTWSHRMILVEWEKRDWIRPFHFLIPFHKAEHFLTCARLSFSFQSLRIWTHLSSPHVACMLFNISANGAMLAGWTEGNMGSSGASTTYKCVI